MLNCFFIGAALYCGSAGPPIATVDTFNTRSAQDVQDIANVYLNKRSPAARSTLSCPVRWVRQGSACVLEVR